jgi:D-alanyl-lipoteichoic acid acyltransferase DltB (MBOAT superfamily)
MLFNSPLYGVFLVATWVLFWALRRARLPRALFLVAASYAFYFYGTWEVARDEPVPLRAPWWALLCLAVIFVGSTIDYLVGIALARTMRTFTRNALLLLSILYYVGVLCVFKYWNFAADSLTDVLARAGVHVSPVHVRLVLPFGISFFTFETMSYTIDVWRGEIPPSRRYLDYLLFVCFFPHLVAGPIVRPAQMLPQLARTPAQDAGMQARGMWRIAMGLAKKIVVGDFLAQTIVRRVFETPERYTALEVLLGVYAYAVQIHADFSGYSDVAIGSAALFGYELPENFDAPYVSRNLQEFWRRWHITLSTWLRDYVYKPLGGSRRGRLATYRNLLITMVLGGLWHGASWTFVVWGTLHGVALAVTRMWQRWREDGTSPATGGSAGGRRRAGFFESLTRAWGALVAMVLTFHFVCFAWIFFRAPSFAHAVLVLQQLARGAWRVEHVSSRVAFVVAGALVLHVVPRDWQARARETFAKTPALVQGVVLAAVAIGLHLAASARPEPFIYGQF